MDIEEDERNIVRIEFDDGCYIVIDEDHNETMYDAQGAEMSISDDEEDKSWEDDQADNATAQQSQRSRLKSARDPEQSLKKGKF